MPRTQAVVIGAGAGGAVVAKELAEGGMDVVLLEEGAAHTTEDITGRPREMVAKFYRDAGRIVTFGTPPIALPVGRGVGGTTLINSGTCFRTPEHVLQRWADEHGLTGAAEDFEPLFERIERTLGVEEVTPELAGANAAVARRGAQRLGWSSGYLQRNARGCVGTGTCAYGCPRGAKQHVGATYVPLAQQAGAQLLTDTRVRRIEPGRVHTQEGTTYEADHVVLAAGTLHTPRLLRRSGFRHRHIGRNLSIHPATAAFARMDEPVGLQFGVPQSYYVDEFKREGFVLEGIAGPLDHVAMALPAIGAEHRELMRESGSLAQFGVMIDDTSRGRVGRLGIRYGLNETDTRRVTSGLERLSELFFAAGAKEVLLPIATRSRIDRPTRLDDVEAAHLKLMAFHPLATARAHADPRQGVVDANLQVHGVPGVHVADGSAVPTSLGVNPQITIMAFATRLADHLLGRRQTT